MGIEEIKNTLIDVEKYLNYLSVNNDKISESFNISLEILEKQIKKKPKCIKDFIPLSDTSIKFIDRYKCQTCNSDVMNNWICCPYCETRIDWSDIIEL